MADQEQLRERFKNVVAVDDAGSGDRDGDWVCPVCTTASSHGEDECTVCGTPNPAAGPKNGAGQMVDQEHAAGADAPSGEKRGNKRGVDDVAYDLDWMQKLVERESTRKYSDYIGWNAPDVDWTVGETSDQPKKRRQKTTQGYSTDPTPDCPSHPNPKPHPALPDPGRGTGNPSAARASPDASSLPPHPDTLTGLPAKRLTKREMKAMRG